MRSEVGVTCFTFRSGSSGLSEVRCLFFRADVAAGFQHRLLVGFLGVPFSGFGFLADHHGALLGGVKFCT